MAAVKLEDILAGVTIISSVGTGTMLAIRHRQVLRALNKIILRLPLALRDSMLHIPRNSDFQNDNGTLKTELQCPRAATQRTCLTLIDQEDFNHSVLVAMSRLQDATTYPLKSRVCVATIVIWLLIAVSVNALYLGNQRGLSTAVSDHQTVAQSVTTDASPTTDAGLQANPPTGSTPTKGRQAAAGEMVIRQVCAVLLVVTSFIALLIVSFHLSVYPVLLDDVVTLCESIGLVRTKKLQTGEVVFEELTDSAAVKNNDADFRALLRVSNRGGP